MSTSAGMEFTSTVATALDMCHALPELNKLIQQEDSGCYPNMYEVKPGRYSIYSQTHWSIENGVRVLECFKQWRKLGKWKIRNVRLSNG